MADDAVTAAAVAAGLIPSEQYALLQQQLAEAQGQIASLMTQLNSQQTAPATPRPAQNGAKLAQPAPFRGSSDKRVLVQDWLFSLNCYFKAANIVSERERINYAVCLFQDHAAQWYRLQCLRAPDGEPYDSWDDLQDALEKQFMPVNFEKRARDQLAALKQTTSVRRYVQEFTNLCLNVPDLHPSEQFHRFVQGLKANVRREVELQDPLTFEEATRIAERVDSISFAHCSESSRAFAPRRTYPSSRPEPMELDHLNVRGRRPSNAPPPPPPHTRLSAEDRRRLRDTNACFYCRQPGHLMANCPVRPKTRPADRQGNGLGTDQGKDRK
jgi:hypothetical protein